MKTFEIEALAPLLFGYGLPFSTDAGSLEARSLDLPRPSTLAGALRSSIGRLAAGGFNPEELRRIPCRGPILLRNGEPLFPSPADAAHMKDGRGEIDVPSRPDPSLRGCVSPPVGAPETWVPASIVPPPGAKPSKKKRPPYRTLDEMAAWLMGDVREVLVSSETQASVPKETRVHVALKERRNITGRLFSTQGVCFTDSLGEKGGLVSWRLACRLESSEPIEEVITLGGERRLAAVKEKSQDFWTCPPTLAEVLPKAERLTLILATPGLFRQGWIPQRILDELGLELVGACMSRRAATAGWDMEKDGLKPMRYAVPAGSVYFFRRRNSAEIDPNSLWLQSVADSEQDRLDGFGLGLWGTW